MHSNDVLPKIEDTQRSLISIISPRSRKLIIRKKIMPKQYVKPLEQEISSKKFSTSKKNRSTKLSSIVISPKVSMGNLNIQTSQLRKNKPTNSGSTSTHSLKQLFSPRQASVINEESCFPYSPGEALNRFKSDLTQYEQLEIMRYSEIFYVGQLKNKIHGKVNLENYGYDDKDCDYLLVQNDQIAYRYEILSLLGKGSFGQVCECFDHKKKEKIALKVIKNKPKFHHQAKVEIKVLQSIKSNDKDDSKHVIKMKNFFLFRSHICITFELLSISLYEFLRINNFKGLSDGLTKSFAKQTLTGLSFLSDLDIVHCDLKPENILLVNSQKSQIKLIDLGSSCFLQERLHTYIQSRYYRAPEIMLGIPYTPAIDMWSFGCFLYELHTGQPLWPGQCENDQLLYIISYFGMPPEEILLLSQRKHLFFDGDSLKTTTLKNGEQIVPASKRLSKELKTADKGFVDLLLKCFDWNPKTRITPDQALSHPWLLAKSSSMSVTSL